jgi:hypothetical protein
VSDTDYIRIIDAELRYYMHISHPESLPDSEWAERFRELEWIRRKEAEANK